MLIREIKFEDLEGCAEVYRQVFSAPPWSEKWGRENAWKRLSHFYKSEGFVGLLAENNGMKGFVLGNAEPFVDGDWFYLREMCVASGSQGQGVGASLLSELRDLLAKLSVKNIYLATDPKASAAKFYLNNGFSREEKMGFYYAGVSLD